MHVGREFPAFFSSGAVSRKSSSGLTARGPLQLDESSERSPRPGRSGRMSDTRFIRSIRLDGFLSFAPGSERIDLAPLNVVIGPNGSGKSNLDRRRPGWHGTLLRTGLPSEKPTPAVKPRGRAQGQLVLQARERDEGHEQGGVPRVQQRKDPACQ